MDFVALADFVGFELVAVQPNFGWLLGFVVVAAVVVVIAAVVVVVVVAAAVEVVADVVAVAAVVVAVAVVAVAVAAVVAAVAALIDRDEPVKIYIRLNNFGWLLCLLELTCICACFC